MNQKQKDEIFEKLDKVCMDMSMRKGADYASDKDVLDNFKRNAERLGLTPFQIWAVYFNKHIDSVNNAIAKTPANPHCITEPIGGRIVDAITYLKLLYCLVEDANTKPE